MKKIFLTSNMGSCIKINGIKKPSIIDNSNKMIDSLKKALNNQGKIVIFPSDPTDYEKNDFFHKINESSFKMSGFDFKKIITIDNRNKKDLKELIKDTDLIILGGGHVPTQNKWFKELNLKTILNDFDGTIIGISAGSMNCADIVYSYPEDEGEAINPNFNRWLEGLGLTDIKTFPHYNKLVNEKLNGLKIIEDIVIPDNYKYPIYAINDGSFIEINNGENIIHGECYKVHNGIIEKICNNGDIKILKN